MRSIYFVLTCCLLGMASCNNGSNGANNTNTDSTKTKPEAPKAEAQSKLTNDGTKMLIGVLNKYYALKNALVATKAANADSAAGQLANETNNLQTFLQKDTANKTNLKPYLDTIITQSKILSAISDPSCEKQRMAFDKVSSAFYGLLKNADLKNAHVYHTYCPMAFNDKGAFWLSEESDIKNPYFGKKMLECGEVTDSL